MTHSKCSKFSGVNKYFNQPTSNRRNSITKGVLEALSKEVCNFFHNGPFSPNGLAALSKCGISQWTRTPSNNFRYIVFILKAVVLLILPIDQSL